MHEKRPLIWNVIYLDLFIAMRRPFSVTVLEKNSQKKKIFMTDNQPSHRNVIRTTSRILPLRALCKGQDR